MTGQIFILGNAVSIEVASAKHELSGRAALLGVLHFQPDPPFLGFAALLENEGLLFLKRFDSLFRGRAIDAVIENANSRVGAGYRFVGLSPNQLALDGGQRVV